MGYKIKDFVHTHISFTNGKKKITGVTQRDGTGREVRGGFRMGNTCTPMVDSCMAKPI